jgi:transposase-like protein
VAIVHDPAASVSPTTDRRGSSLLDGCPECVVNTELPRRTSIVANGFHSEYECSDCGHTWTTDWKDD